MKRDLLTLFDLNKDEILYLMEKTREIKTSRLISDELKGKGLGLLFDKPSTRTRVSFEVAINQLGGYSLYLSSQQTQISRMETVEDTAMTLSRYLDCIVIRTYSQKWVEDFAHSATIPVINGLTDEYHPCQILTDIFTIIERFGKIEGIKIAWVGDGNNMAQTWIQAASILPFTLHVATPKGYEPSGEIIKKAKELAGERIIISNDPVAAVKDAYVINTDVWTSMGQEGEEERRRQDFKEYQLNHDLLGLAIKDAIVLHCLPAHRGEEISHEIMEEFQPVIFEQAENRLHVQKALLLWFLKENK